MSWSNLRRTSPLIGRLNTIRHRQFTSATQSPHIMEPNLGQNVSSLLRWFSGLAVTSGVTYTAYTYCNTDEASIDDSIDQSTTPRFIFGGVYPVLSSPIYNKCVVFCNGVRLQLRPDQTDLS